MGEWIDLPVFATDDLIKVDVFQDIWENVYNLKNLRYAQSTFLGVSGGINSTASTTFADVDAGIELDFESFGSDLLAGLQVFQVGSVTNGGGKIRFMLDGVAYGNTGGQMNIQNYSNQGFEQTQLLYLFQNIDAGDHTLKLQYAVGANAGGSTTLYQSPGCRYVFWIGEFP